MIFVFTLIIAFSILVLLWRFFQLNKNIFNYNLKFHYINAGSRPYDLQRDTSFSQHFIQHTAVCEQNPS